MVNVNGRSLRNNINILKCITKLIHRICMIQVTITALQSFRIFKRREIAAKVNQRFLISHPRGRKCVAVIITVSEESEFIIM